jgi:hypothetical protein
MQERHQVKFINTFNDHRQFQLKLDQTNFEVGDYEKLYFILNGLAYKIHNVNYRRKKSKVDPDKYDILGKVFYFERETNIAFQNNNPNLVEKQMMDLIITDEDLASFGAIIAK